MVGRLFIKKAVYVSGQDLALSSLPARVDHALRNREEQEILAADMHQEYGFERVDLLLLVVAHQVAEHPSGRIPARQSFGDAFCKRKARGP